MYVQGLTDRQ